MKRFYATLDRVIVQDEQTKAPRLRKAVEALLDAAAKGEDWAIQMLADRLDGKPKQQTELTGADGSALTVSFGTGDTSAL